MLIEIVQVITFAWVLIPLEVLDRFGGLRWFGLFAHFAPGISWAALGASLWKAPIAIEPAPAEGGA